MGFMCFSHCEMSIGTVKLLKNDLSRSVDPLVIPTPRHLEVVEFIAWV
jgi:hypothetical protein